MSHDLWGKLFYWHLFRSLNYWIFTLASGTKTSPLQNQKNSDSWLGHSYLFVFLFEYVFCGRDWSRRWNTEMNKTLYFYQYNAACLEQIKSVHWQYTCKLWIPRELVLHLSFYCYFLDTYIILGGRYVLSDCVVNDERNEENICNTERCQQLIKLMSYDYQGYKDVWKFKENGYLLYFNSLQRIY